jgi:DNA gyrase subunit A
LDENLGAVQLASIETEMRTSYLDYAMSVIVQRALPDARDGLKPVQRRILYAMSELGMRNNTRYRKSAGVVGEVLKNFHPHSDTAVYDTLVRMAQNFNLRYPLIDPQGNFGSIDGDGAAAMRYTECRLSSIADEMLSDIDKNTVDFKPNYDASTKEPKVLPATLPNLLLNGAVGIAVGMATNIPPHNLNEVCDAIQYLIDKPDCTIEELMEIVQGPDFPTGGTILGREGIRAAYSTGRGRIVIRAKAFVEESSRSGRFQIVVTELPYQVNKAALLERIAEMVKDGKIDGISDLRDESDRTGMRMIVELKRDSQPMKVLNNLFKHTALQQTFGINMLALVEEGLVPRVLTLKRALQEYVSHRQIVITRRTEFELERAKRRAHVLEGLKKALDIIDQIIATIRKSRSTETARNNLMSEFSFSEVQAQAILDMRLARLAALERKKIEDELKEVLKLIKYLEGLLADPKKILALISDDMTRLKESYGDDRLTRIQDVSGDLTVEDLIPNVGVLVTLTKRGYVKRIGEDVYRTQHRGGKGITGLTMRDADDIQTLMHANTHDSLLVFTNRGRVFQVKVHEIPDAGRTAKGLPIVNILAMQPDETVATMLPIHDYSEAQYLFFTTRLGQVKRTALKLFQSVRSTGMIAIGLEQGDELAWVRLTSGKDEIVLVTEKGQAIRFAETDARSMGRPAAGVIGIRLAKGDRVIASEAVRDDHDLLVVGTRGLGKRTPMSQFSRINRGGKGVTAMKLTERTGEIVQAAMVNGDETVVMLSTAGQLIRIPCSQINRSGRATQGVTLMRMSGANETVASMTIIEPKSEEEEDPFAGISENGKELS